MVDRAGADAVGLEAGPDLLGEGGVVLARLRRPGGEEVAAGVAERALDLMIDRAQSLVTFGEPIANRANIMDWVAEARIEIEMARLLTLKAAHMMEYEYAAVLRLLIDGIAQRNDRADVARRLIARHRIAAGLRDEERSFAPIRR